MNLQSFKYLLILTLTISFGCQNGQNLEGYYSNCTKGEYTEVYFKRDSMRVASENDWVKLSEWRKINIINDTLFFETFGEWKNPEKAKINYIGWDKVELRFQKDIDDTEFKMIQSLEQIKDDFKISDSEEFWTEFKKRKNSADCKTEKEKNTG